MENSTERMGKQSRRDFLKTTTAGAAAAGVASSLGIARSAHAAGQEVVKIAFIGCGGRGTGACRDALIAKGPNKLIVMADVFKDRLDKSLRNLQRIDEIKDKIDVPADRQFIGFDAYKMALQSDADMVLLTTPPGFRPMMYEAAVKAGKHVFMEKPCCVDGPGYRQLVAANKIAKDKDLCVGVGLQRHHQKSYQEGIKKIHDGAIGDVEYVRTYFNMPGAGHSDRGKPAGMPELEWQIRHWGVFTWMSGDHIVEQAIHEIDIANWILRGHPLKANGMGGRQVRTGRGNGQIFDHHFVEYEYEGGVKHWAQARQQGGTWQEVSDNAKGTKGDMTVGFGPYGQGGKGYTQKHKWITNNPYEQEHQDLLDAILSGKTQYEGDYAADSSLTAVLGRMATYSGQVVTWEDAVNSTLDLAPDNFKSINDPAPAQPDADGNYVVAMPGLTKAW